jgi:hypothetical protein
MDNSVDGKLRIARSIHKTMKTNYSKRLITLILTSLVGLSTHAQWVRWEPSVGGNGHWYKAVPNTNNVKPRLATNLARHDGGYLATIASADENAFVFNLVNSPTFFTALNGSGPVLGGRQETNAPEPGGGWYWVTGEPWNYTNWSTNSPNDGGGRFEEDSLSFYSGLPHTPAPTWNDQPFDDPNCGGYVVERDDDPNRPQLDIQVSPFEICWQTATNTWYQLQYCSSLTTNHWLPLFTNWVAGNGTRFCASDAIIVGNSPRFYKLMVTNSPPQ